MHNRPKTIAIGGFASNVGKTTLMCRLLNAFPGWEAIKTTRGHYRSCGKDPKACCVSHLLSDEPVLLSNREKTYAPEKDTGRYWDAGATNVHWMIATEEQVEQGIKQALERVQSPGVFIEGNSFTEFIDLDAFIMVVPVDGLKSKASARKALSKITSLYFSSEGNPVNANELVLDVHNARALVNLPQDVPVYSAATMADLIADLDKIYSATSNSRTKKHFDPTTFEHV